MSADRFFTGAHIQPLCIENLDRSMRWFNLKFPGFWWTLGAHQPSEAEPYYDDHHYSQYVCLPACCALKSKLAMRQMPYAKQQVMLSKWFTESRTSGLSCRSGLTSICKCKLCICDSRPPAQAKLPGRPGLGIQSSSVILYGFPTAPYLRWFVCDEALVV